MHTQDSLHRLEQTPERTIDDQIDVTRNRFSRILGGVLTFGADTISRTAEIGAWTLGRAKHTLQTTSDAHERGKRGLAL